MSEKLRENVRKGEGCLRRFRDEVTTHFIEGKPHRGSSGRTFENLTPVDNTSLGKISEGTAEDIDDAARSASAAFPGWRDMPGKDRQRVLNRFAGLLPERAEGVALVGRMGTGRPLR